MVCESFSRRLNRFLGHHSGRSRIRFAPVLVGIQQRPPTPPPPDRVSATGQRPRGAAAAPPGSLATSRQRRCGTRVVPATAGRRGALLPPPAWHPLSLGPLGLEDSSRRGQL